MILFAKRKFKLLTENIANNQNTPIPQTLEELEAFVQTQAIDCTCDICRPDLRAKGNCLRGKHLKFDLKKNLVPNQYGNVVFAPPRFAGIGEVPPETMHLTRMIIKYFDRSVKDLNNEQLAAREAICKWRDKRWRDIISIPKTQDGRDLVTVAEMRQLWKWFNVLFFGGPIRGVNFRWSMTLFHSGCTSFHFGIPHVKINPYRLGGSFGSYIFLELISTLMHEAVHAFLIHHPCSYCCSNRMDYGENGHGRAFHVLGAKLEEVFPRLLGLPLRLGRVESVFADWKYPVSLPSVHEFSEWKLQDDYGYETDEDVLDLCKWVRKMPDGTVDSVIIRHPERRLDFELVWSRSIDGSLEFYRRRRGQPRSRTF
ncbi:hypothetical protein P280DRAFT_520320 [Massarina eburnea CBS 473.64]|uniref:SprT-like domain-containing protein n=1 Tax=Massarina eburnea CBS 473.64 TaxID=1395130 RepID=A0A6A6RSG1_9PLEO|nr:hypothetical protein P280DRAFT_520320 [Massarina eburnea CBS 473.64]